jgi:hypothetical protein
MSQGVHRDRRGAWKRKMKRRDGTNELYLTEEAGRRDVEMICELISHEVSTKRGMVREAGIDRRDI